MKREQMQDRSKWTQIFLILLLTVVSTQWLSAKISLVTEQTTLKTVINQIKAQTDYQFFYEDRFADLPVKAVVMENASLDEILDEALKDLNVSYKIEDNIVWLSEKKAFFSENNCNPTGSTGYRNGNRFVWRTTDRGKRCC